MLKVGSCPAFFGDAQVAHSLDLFENVLLCMKLGLTFSFRQVLAQGIALIIENALLPIGICQKRPLRLQC